MSGPPVFDGEVAVLSNEQRAGVVTLTLACPPEFESARAGQFLFIASHRAGAPLLGRPMSILGTRDGVAVTFTVYSAATAILAAAERGERLHVFGPLGEPFGQMPQAMLVITDGTHFGTLLGFVQERAGAGHPADVVFITRPPDWRAGPITAAEQDAVLAGRFERVARSIRAVPLDRLESVLDHAPPDAIAAGASDAAMAIVQREAERRAIPGRAALQTAMPCGLGACQGCIFPRRGGGWLRVCDGPVFDLAAPDFGS